MEKFYLIDLKTLKSKKGETFYKLVIYSDLEYLIDVFVSKEIYEDILTHKQQRIGAEVTGRLSKMYNKENQKFSYYYK